MIIDQMTATDRIEYLKSLLKIEQLTLKSVTDQRDMLAEELQEMEESRDFWRKAALNPHR
jgi:hypothetical protein